MNTPNLPPHRLTSVALACGFVAACWIGQTSLADDPTSPDRNSVAFKRDVAPLLQQFCVDCHGDVEQKGDRNFDAISEVIDGDESLVDYQDILDQLNLGEMPPEDSEQPSIAQRRRAIKTLTRLIKDYHSKHARQSGQTVLRRLNSREYLSTVRDLLHLDVSVFDPTTTFPQDQTDEHLDNLGDTLVTSGHLLARYLEAADQVIEKAMHPIEKPKVQTWVFRDGFRQQPEIDQVHKKTNFFKHMTLYDVVGADKHEGAYGPIHAFAEGVPVDGVYEIRLKAQAVNREHPYDVDFVGTDPNEPLRLGIVAGDHTAGNLHLPQPIEPLLAEIELADEPKWHTVKIWLDKGITPRFTFRNGLMDVRSMWAKLIRKYPDQFPKDSHKGIVSARFNAIKHGKLPQIHIDEIEIRGPIYEQWPTPSQREILGDDWQDVVESGNLPESQMRKHLRPFLKRAYRRPVAKDDVDRIVQVIRKRMSDGRSPLDAYGDGLRAALCSPNFLYLDPNPTAGEQRDDQQLSAYALASRLSYFLWASMPDEALMRHADDTTLLKPNVLAAQVERMLKDPKSSAMVDGFLGSWLTLRDLGATPPDRGSFSGYYRHDLDAAMREETTQFTRHLIEENLSLDHFLDADFTFVNKPLAKLYGIDPPAGHQFEKVSLTDRRRGGLLGQASVLTVTANGIDTSPVVRGVWLLENILGTPPTPPPPDVEPLDPDIRGAKSIRDQLQKHRNVPSCNDCHRKIDPLGFALENFDPIGRWRDGYGRGVSVDASGKLPNGKSFDDVRGLKDVLLDQRELFARSLTEKLMSYSVGRRMEPGDRPQIDRVIDELGENGGMRDLIHQIVQSELFRTK